MKWLKFLTNKKLVMVLFMLLTSSFILATTLPQAGSFSADKPAWYVKSPWLSGAIHTAGLDSVFSTRWFFLISLVFFLSLLSTTLEQGGSALRLTRQSPPPGGSGGTGLAIALADFRAALRSLGYHCLADSGPIQRYVKAPWGYWGNFLLHAGMTTTVLFSLVYVLTEQRTLLQVYQGETVELSPESATTISGLLARSLDYPAAVRLEELHPQFWDNGMLQSLAADFEFQDREQHREKARIAVNSKQVMRGQTAYLNPKFGTAFNLVFMGPGFPISHEKLRLPVAPRRGMAVYGTQPVLDGRFTLKAKFLETEGERGMLPQHPELALRLYQGEQLLGEARLAEGKSAVLGPLAVVLKDAHPWAELLFDSSYGVSGIFFGFFLTLCGALILYCTVPREVVIRSQEDGIRVWWKAIKFRDLYREEGERVLAICEGRERA
jgi:cytochrome c biogenesis protein